MGNYSLLRELYEAQRKLPERTFAKDHSFEEWRADREAPAIPELALVGMTLEETEEIVRQWEVGL